MIRLGAVEFAYTCTTSVDNTKGQGLLSIKKDSDKKFDFLQTIGILSILY